MTLAAVDENVLFSSGSALVLLLPVAASLGSGGRLSTETTLSISDGVAVADCGELAAEDVGSSCANSIDSSTTDRKLRRARLAAAASGRLLPPLSLSSSSLALKSIARFLEPDDRSTSSE